jgi:hypothetical protein
MWGWYFFSFGISSKKNWDEPVHQKQLISSVWKLMLHPVQVNLCQKLFFLHPLTHNMTTDCSSFWKIVSSEYLQNMLCTQIVVLFWHLEQFWYTTCSADVPSFWKRFTCIACPNFNLTSTAKIRGLLVKLLSVNWMVTALDFWFPELLFKLAVRLPDERSF